VSDWGGPSCEDGGDSPERLDPIERLVWSADRGGEHILEPGISLDEVMFRLLERERELGWHKYGWWTWVAGNGRCRRWLGVIIGHRLLSGARSL
jgi:hypothetical protein